jgi:hypothetical protein
MLAREIPHQVMLIIYLHAVVGLAVRQYQVQLFHHQCPVQGFAQQLQGQEFSMLAGAKALVVLDE